MSETIQDYQEDLNRVLEKLNGIESKFPQTPDFFNVALTNIQSVQSNITNSLNAAFEATGFRLQDTQIQQLPEGVAGQIVKRNQEISVTPAALDSKDLAHILIHEATHKAHLSNGGGLIQSVALEEGITELATARHTGETIAYQQEVDDIKAIAANNNLSINFLIDAYLSGNSDIFNELDRKNFN